VNQTVEIKSKSQDEQNSERELAGGQKKKEAERAGTTIKKKNLPA